MAFLPDARWNVAEARRRYWPVAEEPWRSCWMRGGTSLLLLGCGGAKVSELDAREDVST